MRIVKAFSKDRAAATSIEYALIAGFISLAIIVGATSIGTKLSAHYYAPVAAGLS